MNQLDLRFVRAMMLPALLLLMTACASVSPPLLPQVIAPPAIPALPASARVSLIPVPSICSPTCSAGLTKLRESWLDMLTKFTSPDRLAKPPATH